jgi:hypothetical protein
VYWDKPQQFEARLSGLPESLIQAVWETVDVLSVAKRRVDPVTGSDGP